MDKKKIVVIDDEVDLSTLIKEILEGTGLFVVSVANDGLAGIELVKKELPELVFLDFVLPKASGDKVIEQLHKAPETQKIPIVLMSGLGEMVYLKNKDQWKWMPNAPGTKFRGKLPDVIAEKGSPERVSETFGVKDFLQKPFRKDTLIEIAKSLIKFEDESTEGTDNLV